MSVALDPRDFVLLSLEARNRGFKSTLAFRRWCQRHGVPARVVDEGTGETVASYKSA